jgi:hypothetical protein
MKRLPALALVALVAVLGLAGPASAQNSVCYLTGVYFLNIVVNTPAPVHTLGSFEFTRPGVPGLPPCTDPVAFGSVRVRIGGLDVQTSVSGFTGNQFIIALGGSIIGFAAQIDGGVARGLVFAGGGGDLSFSGTALRTE